jgi:hypothetical protein
MMTDAILARVVTLDQVTHLSLGGSRELTDAGMQHLAKMPQLTSPPAEPSHVRNDVAARHH